jgi:hypothetical protein
MRQAVDNTAEKQQGEEGDDHHRKKFHGQNIAKILDALEVGQNPVKDKESSSPENQPDEEKEEKT